MHTPSNPERNASPSRMWADRYHAELLAQLEWELAVGMATVTPHRPQRVYDAVRIVHADGTPMPSRRTRARRDVGWGAWDRPAGRGPHRSRLPVIRRNQRSRKVA